MDKILNFINTSDALFYLSENGLLCMKYRGEEMGRVSVLRMFPMEKKEEYLCVRAENFSREDKEKEIGIIRSLSDFEQEQKNAIREELAKRYFIPQILSVTEVKEEFGHSMWKVITDAGEREFTVTDMGSNVRSMGKSSMMLADVYGNRYYISDIAKLCDKAQKVLEIWI